ncbi:MAG: response regulator [Candidatus Orphnella occulta]|nr:response regulator [Candidatus Orphnella occulta]
MLSQKKVLVVDDDVSLINALQECLPEVSKHILLFALTGEEALKVIEEERPDVILLDMQLPGIKGPKVLEIIREKYPKTKVLVITTYDSEVKNITAELGVDGFFPKPINFVEIVNRIEEVTRTKENTKVTPVPLNEITKIDGIMPIAKILFIEREFCVPYLLPISQGAQYPPPVIEPYGEYEYETVYSQKDAMPALKKFKPDIVISATDVPAEETFGAKSASTSNLISRILKSKYAPKAVIVHGRQQDLESCSLPSNSSAWIEDDDIYNYDEKKNKENAERLNKMIWSICYKHNLTKRIQ